MAGAHDGYLSGVTQDYAPTPSCLLGRYTVQDFVADGPIVQTWHGWDLERDRPIGLELLAPTLSSNRQAARRFSADLRDAVALAGHPHVLAVHTVDEEGGRPFAVTDRPPAATLADRLAQGRAPLADVLLWLRQAASALDAAHEQGIVHRDLRPDNLLLDADDHLLLGGFGIAAVAYGSALVSVRDAIGSAAYLAPEQVLDEPATPASDRFALAVVAYELLTGALPFRGEGFTAEARARVEDRPVPPSQVAPDLPAELDAMLLLGLHREPRRRWSSAGLLVDALEATLGPEGHEGEQEEDGSEVDTASLAAPRPAGQPAPGPTTERLTPATTTEPAGARAEQAPPRPGRGRLGIVAVAVGTLAVIAVAAVTLVTAIRGYDETPGGDEQQAAQPTREGTPEGEGASAPPEQAAPESPIPEAGTAGVDGEEAERLNSEGYDLIRSGDHEEAAERFRAGARRAGAQDATYASALFGLARALRLSGRPQVGLTVIERRVEIGPPTENSQQELRRSREAVGATEE